MSMSQPSKSSFPIPSLHYHDSSGRKSDFLPFSIDIIPILWENTSVAGIQYLCSPRWTNVAERRKNTVNHLMILLFRHCIHQYMEDALSTPETEDGLSLVPSQCDSALEINVIPSHELPSPGGPFYSSLGARICVPSPCKRDSSIWREDENRS
jgi:hypothetical protein